MSGYRIPASAWKLGSPSITCQQGEATRRNRLPARMGTCICNGSSSCRTGKYCYVVHVMLHRRSVGRAGVCVKRVKIKRAPSGSGGSQVPEPPNRREQQASNSRSSWIHTYTITMSNELAWCHFAFHADGNATAKTSQLGRRGPSTTAMSTSIYLVINIIFMYLV